jgi:hypothetical protein
MSHASRHIVIDRITLKGFDLSPEQQDAFRGQLAGQLERRLAEDWVGGLANRREGVVQAPPVEMAPNAQPAELAVQVASRIVEGLKG